MYTLIISILLNGLVIDVPVPYTETLEQCAATAHLMNDPSYSVSMAPARIGVACIPSAVADMRFHK